MEIKKYFVQKRAHFFFIQEFQIYLNTSDLRQMIQQKDNHFKSVDNKK